MSVAAEAMTSRRKALSNRRTSALELTEFAIIALLLQLVVTARASSPPEVLVTTVPPSEAQPIFAREGRPVRLPCPVANGRFHEWQHNGKSIYGDSSDVMDRFDQDGRNSYLRISNPRPSNAGRYTCRVANGFGSVTLNMTLIVLGPNGTADGSASAQPGDQAPLLTNTEPAKQETIAGATVRLRCRTGGRPQPVIRWFVGGVEIDDRNPLPASSTLARGSAVPEAGSQTLRLEGVRPTDSASYTCLAYNRAGSVNYTYLLTVNEPAQSPRGGPVMLPPANGTFTVSRPAELRCVVESAVVPRFRWLKEVSDARCDLLDTESDSGSPEAIAGRHYMPVKRLYTAEGSGSQQPHQPSNVHTGRLYVSSVRPEHAGAYLCQATVDSQVLYKEVHLAVLGVSDDVIVLPGASVVSYRDGSSSSTLPPSSASSPSWPYVFGSQSATLAVIVAVPSLIAIFIAIVVIYTFNKRKQERRAIDAKQKRLLLRPDTAPLNQQHNAHRQARPFAGAGGGTPNEMSASPDLALEDKASSRSGSGSAAMAYRPASAGLLGCGSAAAAPLLLPAAATAVPGQRLLTAAYSCSDGGYHSFVQQQQQQMLYQHLPYYVQPSPPQQQQPQCQPVVQLRGSCGSAECRDCISPSLSSSSSDSESHFSSVSQRRSDRSRRVPQPPSSPHRFAQTPMPPGYEDYLAAMQSQPRSFCPPPPPPSVY